jgi:hypothetical protein
MKCNGIEEYRNPETLDSVTLHRGYLLKLSFHRLEQVLNIMRYFWTLFGKAS